MYEQYSPWATQSVEDQLDWWEHSEDLVVVNEDPADQVDLLQYHSFFSRAVLVLLSTFPLFRLYWALGGFRNAFHWVFGSFQLGFGQDPFDQEQYSVFLQLFLGMRWMLFWRRNLLFLVFGQLLWLLAVLFQWGQRLSIQ